MSLIEELLRDRGPMLSSDIAELLRGRGKSPEAARQLVSRRSPQVAVLHGLPFPKRARFLYLSQQFGKDIYWSALTEAIEKANPAYAAAIAGVRAQGGCVRLQDFETIAGAPVKQKGQVSGTTILQRLCSVDLMSKTQIDGIGECVVLSGSSADNSALAKLRARLTTEGVLLDAIRGWAGKMNLASPGVTSIRNEAPPPQFTTCRFDLCGPSYLRPVRRPGEGKLQPGFLVADVAVGIQLDKAGVSPFLRKCALIGNLRNAPRFIPMLIADNFTPEALQECRKAGIITTRPDTLFGLDVARALGDLLQTLSNAAAVAAANPQKLEQLFSSLSAIEGSAGNLRGALFELLVGHMVRALEGGSIDIGTVVMCLKTGQRAEIDVRRVAEKKVVIYECKGYQPASQVSDAEIEDWLSQRVSTINGAHREQERFSDSTFRFEFWTCGGFHPSALARLIKAKAHTKKYEIDWKDGSAVREYAKQMKAPGIRKIFDEHYFNHELASLIEEQPPHELPKTA